MTEQLQHIKSISKPDFELLFRTHYSDLCAYANVNTGDIKGLQAAGFINVAKKVDGAQIGFINIADTIENGVAIGFLSIVKRGYRVIEISGNETFYGNISFKTGTERFYNIISLGASSKKNVITWGWGYGIGTMLPVSNKMKLSIDVISYHVNEDVWFTSRLNSLNKLNVSVEYKISEFLTVYGGPTWNVHVSELYDVEGVPTSTSLVSWSPRLPVPPSPAVRVLHNKLIMQLIIHLQHLLHIPFGIFC